MKAGVLFVAIFAVLMLAMPLMASRPESGQAEAASVPDIVTQDNSDPLQAASSGTHAPETYADASGAVLLENIAEESSYATVETAGDGSAIFFKILDQTTGVVNEVSLRDYVRGAVAAEMPVSFHSEALKAQAVAAHTYALYNRCMQEKNPSPDLKGADLAADPSNMKGYITEEKARAFYGPAYADVYWAKICEAADSVLNYVLVYEEEPIIAAYHAISAGMTESAGNVWGGSAGYLDAVESKGDLLAPNYETTSEFTLERTREILLTAYPSADLSGDPSGWFSDIVRSPSGYVTEISVCGITLHGRDIRTLFGLRSHNVDIFYTQKSFFFVAYGYGHGVGLSQYGADFLARQGYTFDMILQHYYSGVTLKQADAVYYNT